MKINCLQPVFSSLGSLFRFFGKSALFANASFEPLPQLSFWIERGEPVWRKVALAVLLSL
ncbi:hypothetical protein ATY37_20610 [Vibrio cidicii]|uniref:Uncharacterized protein n=1 Tax=Vibrio cidicii TaxID=1763883 RepID=A0A151KTQ0_9VIBR|nr:hypothetical protein ATY37_20610 [Vibrio cidicii]